uniref:Thyroid receptor-interacting protein 11 n=1 Tax=Schistocephalus solidus TaxID=70667 RepID=A0A0X3PXL1_SCHSO
MSELDAYDFFNNDFSLFSSSVSDGALPTKLEQFVTRLRAGLDRITEPQTNARLSKSTSRPSPHDSDDESLATRFARLQEALCSAVNCLPRPPGLSPTPGTPTTAAATSPSWPPTRPEAQIAVLLAAEAAGRAELFRARDALASTRSIISELEDENKELRRCLSHTDMEGEEQDCKQEWRLCKVENTSLQSSKGFLPPTLSKETVSVGVEADHLGDFVTTSEVEKAKLETKLQHLTRLLGLFQNASASFAGVIRGTCEPERFLEDVDLLESSDPLQHEFIGLLKETLNQQCQKSPLPKKNTSSVNTQTAPILQCCAEVMTDTMDHQESSCQTNTECEVAADAVARFGETYSSKHSQTDRKAVCQQCLVLVQFISQCYDTMITGVLSVDRSRILQQLDQLPADPDASLQLRNIVSNFSSMFLRKFEAPGPDMASPTSSPVDRKDFDALARATSEALILPDPDAALTELQQRLQTMESSDAVVTCMRQLLSEYVALRGQYKQAEQDKIALATLVRTKHAESEAYHAQIQTLLTERQANVASTELGAASMEKLNAEIQRLRSHLLQTEENHTKEALAAEEREISLKKQLSDAEKRLATQVEFISSAEDLITSAREERDAARTAGRASQSELNGLKMSYANLQKALENLEKERQSDINIETRHFRLEAERLRAENKSLLDKLNDTQQALKKQDDLVAANQALHKQMELHAGRLAEAHSQARHYEEQIQILKAERQNFTRELDGKLDKSLMKSLLVSCLRLPPSKRPDAFRMLGRILDFTPDECDMLGLSEPVGTNWRNWFRMTGADASAGGGDCQKRSFIELFAEFLEKESAPPTQIKLPTDHLQSMISYSQSPAARRLRTDSTSIVQQRSIIEHSEQPVPHDLPFPSDIGTPSAVPLFIPTISGSTPQRGASANPLLSAFVQK